MHHKYTNKKSRNQTGRMIATQQTKKIMKPETKTNVSNSFELHNPARHFGF